MRSRSMKNLVFVVFAILFYSMTPAMAEQLINTGFTIQSVMAPFGQDHFLIKVANATNNKTGCGRAQNSEDPTMLIVPRSLPQFNEMVSLATAAMLAGKTIRVSQVYVARCHPTWNRSQIDNLEVVN